MKIENIKKIEIYPQEVQFKMEFKKSSIFPRIVMANIMSQLDWAMGSQIFAQRLS